MDVAIIIDRQHVTSVFNRDNNIIYPVIITREVGK